MSTDESAGSSEGGSGDRAGSDQADDKRKNLALRLLVDEMMSTIREVVRKDLWTDAEREAYERDLDRIMGRVRDEALRSAKD